MTNEQVIKRINEIREILADYRALTSYDHEALDIAISALSKQSASGGQADDVPDIHVGKTDFQPSDIFILELGAERRMFGEFEIKGTDLYVKTSLLEKLTRYEPEENATADKILIDLAEAIETVKFECGEWRGLAQTIVNGLKKLSPAQPEIIRCEDCKHRGEKPIADGRYWCDLHGTFMYYCSDAERRTDEGFNRSTGVVQIRTESKR